MNFYYWTAICGFVCMLIGCWGEPQSLALAIWGSIVAFLGGVGCFINRKA